jgi:hypothetical protein
MKEDFRRRSIIKFYGFCSHPEYKFLVYDYDYILIGEVFNRLAKEMYPLSKMWLKRYDIYLHHIARRSTTAILLYSIETNFKAFFPQTVAGAELGLGPVGPWP